MAAVNRNATTRKLQKPRPLASIEEQAKRQKLLIEIFGIILGLFSIFTFICLMKPDSTGVVGKSIHYAFTFWFGWTSYLLPFIILYVGLVFLIKGQALPFHWFAVTMGLLCLDATLLVDLIKKDGGKIGKFMAEKITTLFGVPGAYLFAAGAALILLMILNQVSIKQIIAAIIPIFRGLTKLLKRTYKFLTIKDEQAREHKILSVPDLSLLQKPDEEDDEEEEEEEEIPGESIEIPAPEKHDSIETQTLSPLPEPLAGMNGKNNGKTTVFGEEKVDKKASTPLVPVKNYQYRMPPLDLLISVDVEKEESSARDYSELLEETLSNFGVEVKVINKVRGPTVTRYELQPAKGVKVKKVTNLSNDIALALAAYSIRIEAPIPGKSAIGIEVPNHRIDPVFLREILKEGKYKKQPPLAIALGKDISGKAILDDLLKMPHLLIAGSTGSGKSVCINCVIGSILFKATPHDVQMVMVDPKKVELSLFEGIPHLVDIKLPGGNKIITDPKAATLALKTISEIMDQRYEDFLALKVRNIKEYNEKAEVKIPYIVVVIDELADLMMVSSSTVEQYICRIAQLGRASGIHLIVATQRPSVDVITGLIKANIPSRIAFAVSSQIDSRVILDRVGAEKLLGKGDMLYLPVDANEPRRIQGAYVSGEEIERVVDFWKIQPPSENAIPIDIPEEVDIKGPAFANDGDRDPLLDEALEVIRMTRQASVSNLQRKMKIGYARAGRIMDQLERKGYVGPADGSKPRKILLPGFIDND